jgi:CheY-like chemotaxis protein
MLDSFCINDCIFSDRNVIPERENTLGEEETMMTPSKILVVDDEPNIKTMVRVCLSSEGYDISLASNGREALEMLNKQPVDLLLIDLAMPVMDGMTVLRQLHDTPHRAALRIIVMTAHGSVRAAVQAVRLGAMDFLEKPFSPDDLRISVASVLDETRTGIVEPGLTYDDVLAAVRDALRGGKIADAESLLMTAGTITDGDPCFLNLAGIIHEAHGRRISARRFYQKAMILAPTYEPAARNLARQDEIEHFGKTDLSLDFGDDSIILTEVDRSDDPAENEQ